jgi:hypothetical protein
MATPTIYNMAAINFTMSISGLKTIDVIKEGGVDADGSIEVTFPQDQVDVKEDVTGEYTQFSFKNSKKTEIKISAMHGSEIHKLVAKSRSLIGAAKIMNAPADMLVTCSFKDPMLNISYNFIGAIKGNPSLKYQGSLETVEVELTGTCTSKIETAAATLQTVAGLAGQINNANNALSL